MVSKARDETHTECIQIQLLRAAKFAPKEQLWTLYGFGKSKSKAWGHCLRLRKEDSPEADARFLALPRMKQLLQRQDNQEKIRAMCCQLEQQRVEQETESTESTEHQSDSSEASDDWQMLLTDDPPLQSSVHKQPTAGQPGVLDLSRLKASVKNVQPPPGLAQCNRIHQQTNPWTCPMLDSTGAFAAFRTSSHSAFGPGSTHLWVTNQWNDRTRHGTRSTLLDELHTKISRLPLNEQMHVHSLVNLLLAKGQK